jgi:hypothetical protein
MRFLISHFSLLLWQKVFATKTPKHKDKFYQTLLLWVFVPFVAIFPVYPS